MFNRDEIKFSILLNNFFFNKIFYNYEDNEDTDTEDNEDTDNEDTEKELKIDKISIDELIKIKFITKYVLDNNINVEEQNNCIILQRFIKISPLFSLKNFFKLLDSVNYLHIEFIIKLMVNYLKNEIEENNISDIKSKFDLNNDDFTDNENLRTNLLNNII